MTLQQLRYLVEIFNCGSITGAAQNLYVAQPSLSKSMRELELELGVTIFVRGRTGVSFTAEGMELLTDARSILEQASTMKTRFSREKEALRFTISAQHYIFSVDAMIDYVNRFLKDRPNFTVRIRECKTSRVISDVLDQESQIGILYISDATRWFMDQLLAKKEMEFHPLGAFTSCVYVRRNHPLAQETAVSTDQLLPFPYVRYEQSGDSSNFSEESLVLDQAAKCIFVTDRSTMLSLIKNTDAYNIGSGCLLSNIIDPEIITVPLQNDGDTMQIGWIKLKRTTLPPEAEEYVRMMERSIKKCGG